MARCPNGHENPDDQHFCGECGAPIAPVARAPGPPPGPASGPQGTPPPPSTTSGRKPWYRETWALVAAGVLAVLLIGGAAAGIAIAIGGSSSHTIKGEVTELSLPGVSSSGISDGDAVTVKDGAGKTVGTATLHDATCGNAKEAAIESCFKFTVDVSDTDFYAFGVGDVRPATVKRSKLEKQHWRVSLSIS